MNNNKLFDGQLTAINKEFGKPYKCIVQGGGNRIISKFTKNIIRSNAETSIILGGTDSSVKFDHNLLVHQDGLVKKLLSNQTSDRIPKNYTCFCGSNKCYQHEKVIRLTQLPESMIFYTPIQNIRIYYKIGRTMSGYVDGDWMNTTKFWAGCEIINYSKVKVEYEH